MQLYCEVQTFHQTRTGHAEYTAEDNFKSKVNVIIRKTPEKTTC